MAAQEQDMLEDLAYAESEGSADMMEGESDSWDRGEDEADMYGEADFGEDAYESDPYEDGMEAEEADEFIGDLIGNALGAEDEDEFLGGLVKAARNIAGKVGSAARAVGQKVGQVASYAAPVLKMIPHPYAQAAGRVAGLLSKLKAEGASVEDALEAVAEVAVQDRRALPIVAGLAARSVIKNQAPSMPASQRRQAVRAATRAARTLVNAGGPRAIRAMPKIVRSVKRTAASKGTPASVRPQVLARTAAKVAQRPGLIRNLSRPSPRAQALVQRSVGSVRTFQAPSGATITITVS
jgi:hypothetical protein